MQVITSGLTPGAVNGRAPAGARGRAKVGQPPRCMVAGRIGVPMRDPRRQ